MNQQDIEQVVKAVLLKMQSSDTPPAAVHEMGVFASLDDAVAAAKVAQPELKSVAMRQLAIAAIREAGEKHARDLAELAVSETGMGRVDDKFAKNVAQARGTPGVECLSPQVLTGDNGLTLIENAPWGVVASVTPSTNPAATVINNAISLIAAGNSVIFAPHPAAKKSLSGRLRYSTRRLSPQAGQKIYWLPWQIRISKPRNACSGFRALAFWW